MRISIITITACIMFIGIVIYSADFDPETVKVMPFVTSFESCKPCHRESEFISKITDPARSCDTFCISCHKNVTLTNHHPVKERFLDTVDYKFSLTSVGTLACYTCHDLHVQRFDTSSWMSQSLFDSMFKKKKQYNTYYLVIKNDKGQLCHKCH